MKVTVMTADYAAVGERGKLNALGLGWTTVGSPLPGHGIAVLIEVGWHEANERLRFVLELVDEDGTTVSFENDPDGNPLPAMRLEGEFEVGRPPGIVRGTPLVEPFAINIPPGMQLTPAKRYEYRATLGTEQGSAAFSVVQPVY